MAKSLKMLLLCSALTLLIALQAQAFSNKTNPTISGEVVETMDSGGYTYLQLKSSNGVSSWAAIPQSQVKVGETVELNSGMIMQNFTSNTLGRTFETIVFSSGIVK